jgi:hypothetical protein
MHGKLIFGAGVGIGYVLGTRAGRERFDQIAGQAKKFWENDTVQEAAGAVQTQAGRLYSGGKKMMSEQAHKMRDQRQDRQGKQRQTKEFRKRPPAESRRPDAGMGAPAGLPPNAPSPTTTTPY